jgi:hypothetical protein
MDRRGIVVSHLGNCLLRDSRCLSALVDKGPKEGKDQTSPGPVSRSEAAYLIAREVRRLTAVIIENAEPWTLHARIWAIYLPLSPTRLGHRANEASYLALEFPMPMKITLIT